MGTLGRDFRFGLRQMANSPGTSAIGVAALALGIGANTAIFSVVNTVLLQPPPVREPERLVNFVHHHERRNIRSANTPYADVCEWRRAFRSLEQISAYQQSSGNLSGGEAPERVHVGKVNWTFLRMLGVRPVLGRDFLEEEDRPGAGRVVILTDELWRRRFGGDGAVVGATLSLDGEPYQIAGVLPPRFRFWGPRMDMYVPLAMSEVRGPGPPVMAYGRLKPGIERPQVQPELDAMTGATRARLRAYQDWQLRLNEVREWIVPDVRAGLIVLLGAVALVLLIACSNVACLLLSRAVARGREMAVRAALGAGKWRLMRQLMVESMPLGLLGGGLGLLLAVWGVRLLARIDMGRVPRLNETSVDATVLGFTTGISVLACLLFGLGPALAARRADVQEALKEGGRGGTASARGSRLRAVLVAGQAGLALLLLIGATLLIRSFHGLTVVNPGFNPASVLAASIDLPRAKYRSREQVTGFYEQVIERVQSIPGVNSAALTSSLPLGGNYFKGDFLVEGQEHLKPGEVPVLNHRTVDGNYFRTLEIPLRKGRLFTAQDREGAPPVLIINETTARRFFGDRDPIGRRMGSPGHWMTVVGVTGDVRHTDVSLGPDTEVLLPFAQKPMLAMTLAVRLDPRVYPDPMRFAPLLRRAVAEVDTHQAVYGVASMEKIMADRLLPRRVNMVLLGLFAVLALVLAVMGIYGVVSFTVERRRHEIGVRMALGAESADVVRMVVRQGLTLVLAGVAAGMAGACALRRMLTGLLYGVSATDPLVFSGAAALFAAVAILASYIPARRAARVDPVNALRWE